MNKQELEKVIIKILQEESKLDVHLLKEDGPAWDFEVGDIVGDQVSKTFIDPWVNVLKVIGYEITGVIADITLTLRLFVTFNNKKAKEIIARHNDRMEKLNAKRDKVLNPLLDKIHGEFHMLAFFAAPTTYMTLSTTSKIPGFGRGTADWLEQAGIIDVRAGEMRGEDQDPDRKAKRLEREREEQGPVKKALRALEQIFLLAHHENSGDLIAEQDKNVKTQADNSEPQFSSADIKRGLEETGIMELAKEYQLALSESAASITEALKAFNSQVELLSKVALSNNYDELDSSLSQLKSAIPDLDISELETFKADLQKSAKAYSTNDEKVQEITLNILRKDGIKDPTKEEMASVDKNAIEKIAMTEVFYGSTSKLRSKIVDQLNESLGIYEGMMEQFETPTGAPSEIQKLIDESQYVKDIKRNKAELIELKQKVSQMITKIEKPVEHSEN